MLKFYIVVLKRFVAYSLYYSSKNLINQTEYCSVFLFYCFYLFFLLVLPMVSGFSTASYLKVHVKTHHSSSMLPSSAAHQFPEPRTNRPQMHNGAPYHSGRQCAVEGKLASPHSVKLLLAHLLSFSLLLIRCCICLHKNSPANTDCSAAHLSSLLQNYCKSGICCSKLGLSDLYCTIFRDFSLGG